MTLASPNGRLSPLYRFGLRDPISSVGYDLALRETGSGYVIGWDGKCKRETLRHTHFFTGIFNVTKLLSVTVIFTPVKIRFLYVDSSMITIASLS